MAELFKVPRLGDAFTEGEILEWSADLNSAVKEGDVLFSIETSKSVIEVPAPCDGVLLWRVDSGETVELDQLVAVFGEEGVPWSLDDAQESQVNNEEVSVVTPDAQEAKPKIDAVEAGNTDAKRLKVLPAVRKRAKELGVDLNAITGSGAGGAITKQDVEDMAQSSTVQRVRMSAIRRGMSEHLQKSWREIPHSTMCFKFNGAALLDARKRNVSESGSKPLIDSLFIQPVVSLLKEFPEFNAAVDGEDLLFKKTYDIGIAVSFEEGLLVPVIHAADQLNLDELSREIGRLSQAVKSRKIKPEELANPTFTLSNLGPLNATTGTAILPYGTTAIIAIGRGEKQAVVRNDEVVIEMQIPLTITFDHRAIDGSSAAVFMNRLCEALEAL